MCGIVGVWDFNKRRLDQDLIISMANTLKHRGPDQAGILINKNIGLGHRRLAIIDLSEKGKQPIHNEDESMYIIYNGEFYNFKEQKQELEKKGHNFYTNTDTEVILHLYEEYGEQCVKFINGMFAFAIYDANKKQIFLARDRLGIKPLHYAYQNGIFIFASEIKAILKYPDFKKELNKNIIKSYLTYLYIPSPNTIFKDIYKLPPAHTLKINQQEIKINKYWDLTLEQNSNPDELLARLKKSVELRLMSDVPFGAFLSGGIDSSAIVSLMSQIMKEPVKTFSIGFNEYSELDKAKIIADKFNTDHHEYVVESNQFSLFPKLVYHLDEPFADYSIIPTYLVSKLARKHVKMVLTGDGGDEMFAGYDRYKNAKLEYIYSQIPSLIRNSMLRLPLSQRLKRIIEIGNIQDPKQRFLESTSLFTKSEITSLCSEEINRLNENPHEKYLEYLNKFDTVLLNRFLYLDTKTLIPNAWFKKVDTASSAAALETRSPFLDHTFVQYAFNLDPNLKLKNLTTKYILKKSFKDILPKQILEQKKQGFSLPVNSWIKNELKEQVYDLLFNPKSILKNYFSQEQIYKLYTNHIQERTNNEQRLWALITFELWHRIYMQDIPYEKVLE